jgi:MFS family permease
MPQYLHYHLKLHHLHFTEINELYISFSLHAFSLGLIGIFVPIYIYRLGFSVPALSMFFIASIIASIIIFPTAARFTNRFGPKHAIALSYIILFFYIFLLYLLPDNKILLYPTAIAGGLGAGMFWLARHIDFATVISAKNTTSKFSNLLIFLTFSQALSPFLGGVIATNFGIGYGLLATCTGLLLAIYPLLRTPEPIVPRKTKIRIFRTAPPRHMIANFACNAQSSVGLYTWPLFIFLVVNTYQNVGIIASASLIVVVALLHTIGRMGGQNKSRKILKMGIISRSIVHTCRIFAQTFSLTLGVNILGDISDTLMTVPYANRFYKGARTYDIPAYLVDMEIAGSFGKILIWVVLIIASLLFSFQTALIITFILAALLMPLLRLIEPVSSTKSN